METERHKKQMDLLIYSLQPWLSQQEQGGYVGGNMFVYYSPDQVRNEDYKGPDVFVVLGVPTVERLSWVVWDEGKGPDVVIELLSDSTATNDKNDKKTIYQDQLQVPEYFWYDPFNSKDWAGFRLTDGVYQKVKLQQGRLLSRRLGLSLVRWRGVYQGVKATWLRWATLEGKLLLLSEEAEKQRADAEAEARRQAEQRADAEAEARRQEAKARRQAEQRAQTAEAEIARLTALLKPARR
jgi:Uma2 family endonuclease